MRDRVIVEAFDGGWRAAGCGVTVTVEGGSALDAEAAHRDTLLRSGAGTVGVEYEQAGRHAAADAVAGEGSGRLLAAQVEDLAGGLDEMVKATEVALERAVERLHAAGVGRGPKRPGVGVGAVVVDDGRLLLVRRAGSTGDGTWSVPGGWVEMWEHPLDSAVREVAEETGVTVRAVRPLGWTDAQHENESVHAVTLWVLCERVSGKPTVTEPGKCPEVGFVPFGDVDRLPLFLPLAEWWPDARAELEAL